MHDTEYDKNSKFLNKHKINKNNIKNSKINNIEFIKNNMYTNDENIIEMIYNKIDNPYQKKINLINLFLSSKININFVNQDDIIKFFNWISPLNIEYNMGSSVWNIKYISYGNKKKILFQNSISKLDLNYYFYNNYINLIKQIFKNSKINFNYFEFKSKRFNKIKDIIWAIDI